MTKQAIGRGPIVAILANYQSPPGGRPELACLRFWIAPAYAVRKFAAQSYKRGGPLMPLKLKKSAMEMVAEANREIETISAADAIARKDDPNLVLVDLRDIRELNRDGRIPGAFH